MWRYLLFYKYGDSTAWHRLRESNFLSSFVLMKITPIVARYWLFDPASIGEARIFRFA